MIYHGLVPTAGRVTGAIHVMRGSFDRDMPKEIELYLRWRWYSRHQSAGIGHEFIPHAYDFPVNRVSLSPSIRRSLLRPSLDLAAMSTPPLNHNRVFF